MACYEKFFLWAKKILEVNIYSDRRMNAIPSPEKLHEIYTVLISFSKLRKIAISGERDLVHC